MKGDLFNKIHMWRVHVRLQLVLDHRRSPVTLENADFVREIEACNPGTAVVRAIREIKAMPELRGMSLRQFAVTMTWIDH